MFCVGDWNVVLRFAVLQFQAKRLNLQDISAMAQTAKRNSIYSLTRSNLQATCAEENSQLYTPHLQNLVSNLTLQLANLQSSR